MSREWWIFLGGVVVGAILIFLFGSQFSPVNPTRASIIIKGPDGKGGFELNVTGEPVDYKSVLQGMFSDEFLQPAAIGWLATKQRMYKIDREELVVAISKDLCDPIPEKPLSEKIESGRKCAEKVVAARLRDLSDKRQPPFHHLGKVATMGFPGNRKHRPGQGFANVCKSGDFRGRKLQVSNPANQNVVEVEATGYYDC